MRCMFMGGMGTKLVSRLSFNLAWHRSEEDQGARRAYDGSILLIFVLFLWLPSLGWYLFWKQRIR
jgi:hypothetical protein